MLNAERQMFHSQIDFDHDVLVVISMLQLSFYLNCGFQHGMQIHNQFAAIKKDIAFTCPSC